MMKWIGLSVGILAVVGFGFALANCGDDGGGGECKRTADCQSKYGDSYYCDLNSKTCVCSPACSGKCCGDDGCGGTCPDECTAGNICNASCECEPEGGECTNGQTRCNNNVAELCQAEAWTTAEDCTVSGATCVNGACEGGTCTNGTYRCNGNTSELCTGGAWGVDENCDNAGEVCNAATGQCEPAGGCTQGETRCNGTIIQTCNAGGTWDDGTDCNTTGQACSGGACVDVQPTDECPQGQDCTDISGDGYMGCTEGGAPPAGNMTGCDENTPCPANQSCLDDGNGGTICIANCGTCGMDELCEEVGVNGTKACLPIGGDFPVDDGCDQNGCTGNQTCWSTADASFCLPNCTLDGACTNGVRCVGDFVVSCTGGAWVQGENCTDSGQTCFNGACASSDLCPAGRDCTDLTGTGVTGCLEADNVPPDAPACDPQTYACPDGFNAGCWNVNDELLCIENCGVCPAGRDCTDLTGTGVTGCLENDNVPADAPACDPQTYACPDGMNASCWNVNDNLLCIENCSVPH